MARSLYEKRGGRYPRPRPGGGPLRPGGRGWGVEGDFGGVYALLDAIEDRTTDVSDVWPAVGEWFAGRQRNVFAKHNRGRWAPRRPSYIAALRRQGLAGGGVMVRSGSLLRAASSPQPQRATGKYAVFGIGPGSNRHQAQIARWLAKGRPSMPRRSAVPGLTAGERRDVGRVVKDHILKGLQ